MRTGGRVYIYAPPLIWNGVITDVNPLEINNTFRVKRTDNTKYPEKIYCRHELFTSKNKLADHINDDINLMNRLISELQEKQKVNTKDEKFIRRWQNG